ncbi:MAG: acylphosphatase [Parcubacteria group bacterium GW2011_GWA1_47_11]|nr:MAG: acylphosphatase [Parcubacteria group bacterium GW2011_GWA1_47_11]
MPRAHSKVALRVVRNDESRVRFPVSPQKMPKHLNILISGAVQGVFFRAHAKKKADELGITGFVMNQRDRRVYIEAEGPAGALQQLVDWCKEGPDSAEVSSVEIKEGKVVNFSDFQIKY